MTIVSLVCTGARTVLHPKCRIIAEAGPIVIGESNLIEELVEIVNRCAIKGIAVSMLFSFCCNCCNHVSCCIYRAPVDSTPGGVQTTMVIGNNNVFEVGCCILE